MEKHRWFGARQNLQQIKDAPRARFNRARSVLLTIYPDLIINCSEVTCRRRCIVLFLESVTSAFHRFVLRHANAEEVLRLPWRLSASKVVTHGESLFCFGLARQLK
jgi:hypothetical protein